MDQQAVLHRVVEWAAGEDNIRLVVLSGSVARDEGDVDELSDLDVELYVVDPRSLLERREWYERFGTVLVVEELENPGWHPTRLVYYEDGKIDFMIGDIETARTGVAYDEPYRVVIDKDGAAGQLRHERAEVSRPSPSEFLTSVDWFFAAALMEAKSIVRAEPWSASFRDRDLKDQLMQMIQWDHRSRHGWGSDTWHNRSRRWMDEPVREALEGCWPDFSSRKAATSALRASLAMPAAVPERRPASGQHRRRARRRAGRLRVCCGWRSSPNAARTLAEGRSSRSSVMAAFSLSDQG